MIAAMPYRSQELPWTLSEEQEKCFRRILGRSLVVALLLSIAMPFLPVTEQARTVAPELPQRYAKLILEKKPPPPKPAPMPIEPEPVVPEVEAVEPKPLPEPEPKPVAKAEPKPEPKPIRVVTPEPEPSRVEAARDKAASSGLLAMKDQLADLRDHAAVDAVTGAGDLAAAADPARTRQRSLITSGAAAGSGGVKVAALSRDTGGRALAGRSTTRVDSPVAGTAAASTARRAPAAATENRAGRSREDIEKVFDRNKAAIYALYNRALRRDPTLQGKVVLRLTIAASGQVTDCEILSSDLANPELERKLVQRIRLFDFGALDVAPVTITKPIDFLPA